MPNILKPGRIPYPTTPWQETTAFRCPNCGCEWYALSGEWQKIEPWVPGDAGCAGMDCPTCGKRCQIREPGKPITRGLPSW